MTKSKKKPPRKTGRPSLYDADEHPRIARRVMGEGKTLSDLAEVLGVNRSTVDQWRTDHVEFSGMVELGRIDATDRVERALFERATGYSHASEKIVVLAGLDIERVPIVEHYPPDTAAALAWLKNRRSGEWRDRQQVELTGKVTIEQLLSDSWKKPEEPKP